MSEQVKKSVEKTFVKDQFYVDGVISCKFISSVYSDEYKQKINAGVNIGKEKLRFELTNDSLNDTLNNQIINQLKIKELYFLKKTLECTDVKFPLGIKTMLNNNDIVIAEVKTNKEGQIILLRKQFLEKTETCTTISDKVSSIVLKVDFDINEKTIKSTKFGPSGLNLSLADLIQLVKTENLKLRVKIKCGGVYLNDKLHISGTLEKISLEQSKMAQIYSELKEKENNKVNLLPKSSLYISQFPKKSSTITANIIDALDNLTNKN